MFRSGVNLMLFFVFFFRRNIPNQIQVNDCIRNAIQNNATLKRLLNDYIYIYIHIYIWIK